ncbi:uncharacterized protein DUF3302 [Raoultella ornithinolytica]|jgi:hypothetical protein|uniref:Uncharacterized protein DUF3302 n=1 Tax=Raoultella ornithinolytica TaxID=54291 RepID=A0ABD7QLM4_RAOOR|nr:DUF3302 domain-containing protein [Raoultella terrigena]ROS02428.1 uncharacterized protein DUF3302 [Raoultella terrigena]TCQ75170.1 uncharacterized protein DUF3302 [Raoultella ornithinolytica]
MTLDYIALAILIAVVLILFYGIIVIHDIPYEIAKKRNHPHQDAIHYAGWVSLFTLHVLWPLLWIWATLWREDRGWGMQKAQQESDDLHRHLTQVLTRLDTLQQELNTLKGRHPQPVAAEGVATKEDK